ncbi:MAG: hypothetical protein IKU08_06535 [Clostridia bacterium]|nr:hypothetical protein [Clostridia bacterium]
MNKDFFVCSEEKLYEVMRAENPKHRNTPKIYMAGYTRFASWVYEDYSPDSDYCNERFYVIDYSDDGEDSVWEKFFDYNVLEIFNESNYIKLTVDRDEYNIDVICNEYESYSLSAFWHSAELSEDEMEWLKDQEN